jgi:hypothetical protein
MPIDTQRWTPEEFRLRKTRGMGGAYRFRPAAKRQGDIFVFEMLKKSRNPVKVHCPIKTAVFSQRDSQFGDLADAE